MAAKRVQAVVSGHVQGVGFRYFAVHTAIRLGLTGTVRNAQGNEVEVIAEGDEPLLSEFLSALHKGPSAAHVTNMQVAWSDPDGGYEKFTAVA